MNEGKRKLDAKVIVVTGMFVVSLILLFVFGPNTLLYKPWNYISPYIGWLYFCAWSVSFYPQVFLNYRRKSVVGLSFDFVSYNCVAFTFYTIYNFSLLYVPEIRREYEEMFHQHIPVVLNDLFFSAHAMILTYITAFQCCIYEREGQRVSRTAIGILCLIGLFVAVCIVAVCMHWFSWLTPLIVIIIFSNIKLVISFIKYFPQLIFNCKRKSTYPHFFHSVALNENGGLDDLQRSS